MTRKTKALLMFGPVIALPIVLMIAYRDLTDIYQAALLRWIGDEVTRPIDKQDRRAIVDALFDYTNREVDGRMMPGLGKKAVEYLEYGYALCDQQALLLTNLLYHQGIEARVVPLYYEDGHSDHTMMEWHDGNRWLLLDPLYRKRLHIPAREFVSLSKDEVLRNYPSVDPAAYDFYAKNYFREIRDTYRNEHYKKWHWLTEKGLFRQLKMQAAALPSKILGKTYLELLQTAYVAKNHGGNDLDSRYLTARNHELLGRCETAINVYRALADRPLPAGFPNYDHYLINQKMLQQRMEINRAYCPRASETSG